MVHLSDLQVELGDQFQSPTFVLAADEPLGQRPHGPGGENVGHTHGRGVEPLANARHGGGGQHRVAAELEEVVVNAGLGREQLGDDGHERPLEHRFRQRPSRAFGRRHESRQLSGRGAAVRLTSDGERDRRNHLQLPRNHVRRHEFGHRRCDALDGEVRIVDRNQGRQYVVAALASRDHAGHCRADAGNPLQRGLDVTELDPVTADLHAVIGSPDELQDTVGPVARQIA